MAHVLRSREGVEKHPPHESILPVLQLRWKQITRTQRREVWNDDILVAYTFHMNLPITTAPLRANLVNENVAAENQFLLLSTAKKKKTNRKGGEPVPAHNACAGVLGIGDEDGHTVLTVFLDYRDDVSANIKADYF